MGNRDLSLFIGQTGMDSQLTSTLDERQVVFTETTAEGMAYLDSETEPACIVTDHSPPQQDCFELLGAVSSDIPVILAPTSGSSELATRAYRAGAAAYIDPTTVENGPQAIAEAVERVVNGRLAAAEADERIEQFVSIVSHELRSPIQKAKSGIDLANAQSNGKYLDKVATTLDQMDALIDNLLDDLQENETRIQMEPVELSAVVESAWPNQTTATLSVESELPTIEAEASRLRQLLNNLFRNSVEHASTDSRAAPGDSREGRVTVRVGVIDTSDRGDSIGLYIADDGPGIDPDHREEIFEYGYTRSDTGTGFGLAIVTDIVNAFGWEISVTESASGGARFEITKMKKV